MIELGILMACSIVAVLIAIWFSRRQERKCVEPEPEVTYYAVKEDKEPPPPIFTDSE